MSEMRVLTEAELRTAVSLDASAVDVVEQAFAALATKHVAMPPILRLDVPENNGEVDVKTAYIPGLSSFAIKVSPGFFDNPKIGLPSVNGMMMLLSAKTGLIEALFLDNGYLTDIRTAAAGAVAARHLARKDATIAAVFGAGVQARLQIEALSLVRPLREVRVWARDKAAAGRCASDIARRLGITATPADDASNAVAGAHIVVTTTPATSPILLADWLEPGQHVTCMGSDAEHKNELDPAAIAGADLYVPDRLSQTRLLGELHHAIAAKAVSADAEYPELGAIVAGRAKGRDDDSAITIADLTGTGVQDTAIATLAFARIRETNAGTVFSS